MNEGPLKYPDLLDSAPKTTLAHQDQEKETKMSKNQPKVDLYNE